jgi:hypothetical protein
MAEMIDFKAFFEDYEFPFHVDRCENGWYCLSIPLFHSDGDGVEIYVRKNPDGTFFMSEDGWTLGVHCCFDKRHIDILKCIIAMGDGVKYIEKHDEIAATATEENFAYTLWQMVSVILAVDVTAHALAKWHVMEAAKHGSGGKTEGADKGTN